MRYQSNITETDKVESSHPRSDTADFGHWTNSEASTRHLSHIVSIQRAWRSYRNSKQNNNNVIRSTVDLTSKEIQSDKDETSETDSCMGVQMMSLSSPEDSERNLKTEDDDFPSADELDCGNETVDESDIKALYDRKNCSLPYSLAARCGIDSEPESIVSDYSEMADPIKEHLANVQIIQKEDLDLGNTFVNNFVVQPKIFRGNEEDEEEFNKRVRKTNYLSLAQEFAELKKINASALPFGLHKDEYKTASPLSDGESGSGSDLDCAEMSQSNVVDLKVAKDELDSVKESWVDDNNCADCERVEKVPVGEELGISLSSDQKIEVCEVEVRLENPQTHNPVVKNVNFIPNPIGSSANIPQLQTGALVNGTSIHEMEIPEAETGSGCHGNKNQGSQRRESDACMLGAESDGSVFPESPGRVKLVKKKVDEALGEFDIYTMETALPQMDWQHLEEQLQKAAEEEKRKWLHCGDREKIRRKLAMPVDDDAFDSDLLMRKTSLQTRLQTNMNLDMCFVNEAAATESAMLSGNCLDDARYNTCSTPDVIPVQTHAEFQKLPVGMDHDENEDFFTKQARLQAEAKMALAQVRPMAHMQLQLEKQLKKKSPLAEIVGIPGFIDGKFRHLSNHLLQQMNFAQLQVVVNDLHAQIEVLNTELMQQLVERDDLHMAQDSMLVDIEDLTGRAQEFAARVNKRAEKKDLCLK